jgi:hypothetical protein
MTETITTADLENDGAAIKSYYFRRSVVAVANAGQWCRRCGGPCSDSSGLCGEC